MFSLTVTDLEINDVLSELTGIEYPNSIKLEELTRIIFGTSTDIQRRKVRLAIAELRKRGYLIIAKRGYSMAGDNPEQVIHFINGLYSRAHKLTDEADTMFHELKRKYGDEVSAKVKVNPDQPMLGGFFDVEKFKRLGKHFESTSNSIIKTQADIDAQLDRMNGEPAFQKTYDRDGTLHNL